MCVKEVAMSDYVFRTSISRRLPDPTYPGAQRHILLVRAEEVPEDLPRTPNPRSARIDRGIYKDVRHSLLNGDGVTPNTFHLKNKGITLLANEVKPLEEGVFAVDIDADQGIVDGGHTYEVALSGRDLILSPDSDSEPIEQYIKFEILTNVPRDLWPEIAGGLNTAVQVQEMSLANLRHEFDWIQKLLENEPYFDQIAFSENEADTKLDVRDLIVLMDLMNVADFPNRDGDHPTRAYNNKNEVLQQYLAKPDKYKRLGPILKDILRLHDQISSTAGELHNASGGRAASLSFVETKRSGMYKFHFIGKEAKQRLHRAALLPMVGAFRWMVQDNGTSLEWRDGFTRVLEVWNASASEMMRATKQTNEDYGYKLTALGKSRNHWATLHSTVAKNEVLSR
jgi:hypothetical protein